MTSIKRIFTLPVLCLCMAAAGCGGGDDEGDPIPAEQADALLQQLDVVQNRLDNGSVGACRDVFTHAESPNQPTVEEILTQIPQGVDPEVRSALEESFARLWELVDQECDERQPEEPAEPAPEEPTPEEQPTESVPEEEPTESVPEEEEPVPPEEEPLPPEGDGDNDGEVPPADGGGGGVGPGGAEGE